MISALWLDTRAVKGSGIQPAERGATLFLTTLNPGLAATTFIAFLPRTALMLVLPLRTNFVSTRTTGEV